MAKPDWGELQQRFLSEHTATGVSPKEWCEAQGLNYASARRYIKKPAAQSAQNPVQKKVRTAQIESSAEGLLNAKLGPKVKRFIAEYLKDQNATAAAERAGYSGPNYGRQLIANPNVAQAIAQQQKASIARTLADADEVLTQMWQLATFDANQLSQYRRGACRYCWGFGHHYQWRDAVEFDEETAKVEGREGARLPEDTGGYPAENIINWRTKRINGRDQLVLVVLRECVEQPDGYAYKDEIQYRELALEEGKFICRVWRRSGGTVSGTYTIDSEYGDHAGSG